MNSLFYTTVIKRKSKITGEVRFQAQIRPIDKQSQLSTVSKTFKTRQEAQDFISTYLKEHTEDRNNRRLKVGSATQGSMTVRAADISVANALFIYAREVVSTQKNRKDMYFRINRFLRAAGMKEIDPLSPRGELHQKPNVTGTRTKGNGQRTAQKMRQARQTNNLTLNAHIEYLANLPFSCLGAHDIERFKRCNQAGIKPLAPTTINHFINLFRKLVKTARKEWHWEEISLDVYHNSSLLSVPKSTKAVVLPEHFIALIEHTRANGKNVEFLPFILLSAMLGTRFSELAHKITWEQIKWQTNVMQLTPEGSKAGQFEQIVMTDEVKAVLRTLPNFVSNNGPLFNSSYESIRACLKRAWKALDLPNYGLHQFRHTAITDEAYYNGGDVGKTQLFSRHNSVSMAMHYTHTDFEQFAQEKRHRFAQGPMPKPKYPRVQEVARNAALGYPLDFQYSPQCPTPTCSITASAEASRNDGGNVIPLRFRNQG